MIKIAVKRVLCVLLLICVSASTALIQWDRLDIASSNVDFSPSHLWTREEIMSNPRISFLNKLLRVIHAVQRPPQQSCRSKRLLVLQMRSTSFEGTGSLIKQILIGLSIAVHSNRTLVWGLGLPYIFEHSQELWAGKNNQRVLVGNDEFDCRSPDPAGGAFGCFFEPMTRCSLADASASDILAYSLNSRNDSARLQIAEVSKRGIALYHPPEGLYDYILSHQSPQDPLAMGAAVAPEDIRGIESHLWVAAISAYFFRLKPKVAKSFQRRAFSVMRDAEMQDVQMRRPLWGLHIRHGDLKANPELYRYKTVFEFEDYFAAARDLSHVLQSTPMHMFISTDSISANNVETLFANFMKNPVNTQSRTSYDKKLIAKITVANTVESSQECITSDPAGIDNDDYGYYDEDEDDRAEAKVAKPNIVCSNVVKFPITRGASSVELVVRTPKVSTMRVPKYRPLFDSWYTNPTSGNKLIPSISAVSNENRYRTPHGSHTVAANGGCQKDENYDKKGMKCALDFDVIMQYQADEKHLSVPRYYRIFRVFAESIEDIFQLSQVDVLIGQGSSYYSTLATYLMWARTGCLDAMNSVLFLDQGHVSAGVTPTAHLHGMNLINSTYGYDPSLVPNAGRERWKVHSLAFISALEAYAIGSKKSPIFSLSSPLDANPWAPENYMSIVDLLPKLPDKIFYREARSWLFPSYKPAWPGSCPGRIPKGTDIQMFVTDVANMGNDMHAETQITQAAQCWWDAKQAILEYTTKHGTSLNEQKASFFAEALDVVTGNLKSLLQMSYADLVLNESIDADDAESFNNRKAALFPPGFLNDNKLLPSTPSSSSNEDAGCRCGDPESVSPPKLADCIASLQKTIHTITDVAFTDETIEEHMREVDKFIDNLYSQLDSLHSFRGKLLLAMNNRDRNVNKRK